MDKQINLSELITKDFSNSIADSIIIKLESNSKISLKEPELVKSLFVVLNKDYNNYSNLEIADTIDEFSTSLINEIKMDKSEYPNDEINALISVA